ncbi:MAG: PIG-L family deacetylase, partial [Dehalococcoidia bacterium]|nr:PIG-L family deacetylase [Dehalococcoidia bacterium]
WASDDPDHYVDIADTFDIKVAALGCHESQVGQKIHPDLRERVLRRAKDMAEGTAFNLVEAFHRVEPWG